MMKLYKATKVIHTYFFSNEEDYPSLVVDGAQALESEVQTNGIDIDCVSVSDPLKSGPVLKKDLDVIPWNMSNDMEEEDITIGDWLNKQKENL